MVSFLLVVSIKGKSKNGKHALAFVFKDCLCDLTNKAFDLIEQISLSIVIILESNSIFKALFMLKWAARAFIY